MEERSKFPSKEQIKERTKHLREALSEKYKVEVSQGHALEVMAKVFGFKDWNTASALTQKATETVSLGQKPEPPDKLPIAAKFQTVGEYQDFFAKFDRNKKVVFNEYKDNGLGQPTTTSVCSGVYDYEIQNGEDLHLELQTEEERDLELKDFSASATQKFEYTSAGRCQRVVKYLAMLRSPWMVTRSGKN